MVARAKKKTIKFELTHMGLPSAGVVLFCIILWMFLLGIWVGQSILVPSGTEDAATSRLDSAPGLSLDLAEMPGYHTGLLTARETASAQYFFCHSQEIHS